MSIESFDINTLIGLEYQVAVDRAFMAGFRVRKLSEDGSHYVVTRDLRNDRIGLHIDMGLITGVEVG